MATEKPVVVVGVDDSEHSMYALEWALDHFFIPHAPNFPFQLYVVYAKPSATSVKSAYGFAGPGFAEGLPLFDSELKKKAAKVIEQAKQACLSKSVNDAALEIMEGDARNALCEAVDRHHASSCSVSVAAIYVQVNDAALEIMEGDARNALCEAVDRHHASMLVVGSHGYGAIKRAVLGSVSDYCAHHAHCSVLIVKRPKIKH